MKNIVLLLMKRWFEKRENNVQRVKSDGPGNYWRVKMALAAEMVACSKNISVQIWVFIG